MTIEDNEVPNEELRGLSVYTPLPGCTIYAPSSHHLKLWRTKNSQISTFVLLNRFGNLVF